MKVAIIIIAITIILGVAVFIIGASIIKKDKKTKPTKNNDNKEAVTEKDRNKLKKLLEIKNILPNGTIIFDGNRYGRIFYISSQDFDLLSEAEQTAFENELITFARALTIPVQFYTTTQKIDTTKQIKQVDEFILNSDINENLKRYATLLKDRLDNIQKEKGVYVRKSYISFNIYEPNPKLAEEKIQNETRRLMNMIAKTGMRIERLNREQVLQLLHDELNKNKLFRIEDAIKNGVLDLLVTGKGVVIEDEQETENRTNNPEETREPETIAG